MNDDEWVSTYNSLDSYYEDPFPELEIAQTYTLRMAERMTPYTPSTDAMHAVVYNSKSQSIMKKFQTLFEIHPHGVPYEDLIQDLNNSIDDHMISGSARPTPISNNSMGTS